MKRTLRSGIKIIKISSFIYLRNLFQVFVARKFHFAKMDEWFLPERQQRCSANDELSYLCKLQKRYNDPAFAVVRERCAASRTTGIANGHVIIAKTFIPNWLKYAASRSRKKKKNWNVENQTALFCSPVLAQQICETMDRWRKNTRTFFPKLISVLQANLISQSRCDSTYN